MTNTPDGSRKAKVGTDDETPVIVVDTVKENDAMKGLSQEKKYRIFMLITAVQVLNQLAISGLYPALPEIRTNLHTTETVTNATGKCPLEELYVPAAYSFLTGVLPTLWACYSAMYGRRPIYAISNLITILGNVGSALSVNIAMLIVFRAVTSVGASACVALGAGVITEVFNDNERGRALSWNNAIPISFTAISPIICGALVERFGWRSIFWFFAICYTVLQIGILFFLPETNLRRRSKEAESKGTFTPRFINPLKTLKLLKRPNFLLTTIYMGLMFFVNYAVNISFTWAYSTQYNFNSTGVGLCFMLGTFGYCVGAFTAGSLSDRVYRRRVQEATERREGVYPEMRLSQIALGPAAFVMAGGYIAYGWCIEKNVHFAFGMVAVMFGQLGMMIWVCFLTIYSMQCFPGVGASTQACIQIVKNMFITVATLVVIELQGALGHGILYSICGGVLIATSYFTVYIQANKKKWEWVRTEKHP
ncbi:major facilitator superfamily domain-containing protein [Fennellomyces sp. T-0311]|nr:major facilitator superfamily domain-containing protein [Fennellomyces sp. T-0311]